MVKWSSWSQIGLGSRPLIRTAQSLERTGETVVTKVVSLRRRLDIRMLRWQARLDSKTGDRIIPWLTALVLTVLLSLLGLARSRDLGIEAPHERHPARLLVDELVHE